MSYKNTTISNINYSQSSTGSPTDPFVTLFSTRDPTEYDFNYPVQKRWLNTTSAEEFILVGFTTVNNIRNAIWQNITSGITNVKTLTGDSGGAVSADATNNINTLGSGSITIVGDPGTNTLTTQLTGITEYNVLVGGASTTLTNVPPSSTAGNPLVSNGDSADPSFSATPAVTSITITDSPVNPTDGANKAYVDMIGSGFTFKAPCYCGTTANLTATYANGADGIGATLTNAGALAAFSVDGVTPALTSRVLVKDQTALEENGIYTVTTAGDGVTPWVLTRATDYDEPAEIMEGDLVPVQYGDANQGTFWSQIATVTTIGTDPIVFINFLNNTVPNGGTGATSFTAYAPICGGTSSTSPLQSADSGFGNAGYVLTSTGSTSLPTWQMNTSGTLTVVRKVYVSNTIWTPTAGLIYAEVWCCGGGGGGGGASGGNTGGGGGGGGTDWGLFSAATLGASQSVTVGGGGGSGSGGGTSTFGSLLQGNGGSAGQSNGKPASGGSGGVGTRVTNFSGGGGGAGIITNSPASCISGAGGSSFFGGGGAAVAAGTGSQTNGNNASGNGGGGSGAASITTSGVPGGSGGNGIVIVVEYVQT